MLHRFASYIMRGRRQAVIVGLLFTILPLFGWVSNVIVSLVTLRKGAKEGAIVLLWIILPAVVVASLGNRLIILYGIIGGSLFTYVLALVLRQTQSWKAVLTASLLIGLFAVLLVHAWIPNITEVWVNQFGHYALMVKNQFNVVVDTARLQFFAKFATGFQVAFITLSGLINLILARGFQSMLYNPGQLRPELKTVRLSLWEVLILLVIGLLSFLGIVMAQDAISVVGLIFILAGLSVVHALADLRNVANKWIFLFYVLLVVFFPYVAAALVIFAVVDSVFNLRYRLKRNT
ncbi:DUF2232 domain-containing protein [Rickettsiella endosymbiont of Rhagonycha lignosa]|uniref:DUF2232 domain-containing protein n=1 Tax=Rickettsiella endosymbiont of Rhagonycha lignosa TaxID=3077937 RepID=UPI00313D3DAA